MKRVTDTIHETVVMAGRRSLGKTTRIPQGNESSRMAWIRTMWQLTQIHECPILGSGYSARMLTVRGVEFRVE